MNKTFLLLFFLASYTCASFAQEEKRLALVIGNSEYTSGKLNNAVNDANKVSVKLKTLGFDVILKNNATNQMMGEAINDFTDQAANYDVALFYYAGHGIQSKGSNYLIPVNDNLIEKESDIEYNSQNVNRILRRLEDSGCKLKIIILDACRNNPFERSWYRTTASKGLSPVDAPYGTLIQYSTRPGETAKDVGSPYATAFLQVLDTDLPILDFFSEVCDLVYYKYTEREQMPWTTNTAVNRNFRFNRIKVESKKSITFNLTPSNATIKFGNTTYKNGQSASFVMGSTYSFSAEADGYQTQLQKITISESTPSILTISLKRKTPEIQKKEIQFNLQPLHAVIKFGDTTCKNEQSLTFQQGSTYSYVVEAEGYQSISGKFTVDETTRDQMAFSLPIISTASVYITSNASASIYIDGKYVGITPKKVTTTIGQHEMKLTADRYYNEVITLDIAEGDNPKYVYMTKKLPWFGDSDKYEAIMLNYHFSPVYPITISGMYQFDDYPFAVGLILGSSTGFYRGWSLNNALVFTQSTSIESSVSVNGGNIIGTLCKIYDGAQIEYYSEFVDPYNEAVHYDSDLLLLGNSGIHICNGILLEVGLGVANHTDKYYMDQTYQITETKQKIEGGYSEPTYTYEKTGDSHWYKNPKWSFASRIGTRAYIPLDRWEENQLSIGGGYIWTPNLAKKGTWDISLGYKYVF